MPFLREGIRDTTRFRDYSHTETELKMDHIYLGQSSFITSPEAENRQRGPSHSSEAAYPVLSMARDQRIGTASRPWTEAGIPTNSRDNTIIICPINTREYEEIVDDRSDCAKRDSCQELANLSASMLGMTIW